LHTQRDESLFAEATLKLLTNVRKRYEMSEKGIKAVKEYWTLKHAGDRLSWHFKRLVDGR
jgi:Mor family transcriptional regulator